MNIERIAKVVFFVAIALYVLQVAIPYLPIIIAASALVIAFLNLGVS